MFSTYRASPSHSSHAAAFADFLNEKVFVDFMQWNAGTLKVINRDQWNSFWEFACVIETDCQNYDENSSWPVLFDSFVAAKKEGLY